MSTLLDHISFYFPSQTLHNSELSRLFKVTEQKILKSTGIRSRYISGDQELASDMAYEAVETFFKTHSISRESIDFLIFCSECYDYIAPTSSCILQGRLNLAKTTGCIDMPYGCSGYVYGLAMAKSFIHSGIAKNILFVTADTSTKTISSDNLELRSIFSDAASVTFINSDNYKSIGEFVFGTDGNGWESIYISRSAFKIPIDADFIEKEKLQNGKMVMNGMDIFNFGLKVVPKLVSDTLVKNNVAFDDIDLFVFHQPSLFLLNTLRKKMNIPEDKFFINIENHGNTVSTTIPLALKDAESQGRLKKGMTVLLAGFGIGFSWAGTIIKI
jgi:3-oxoacyl-[acyl-carrier-protein] synthase-3